ncbi:MAG: DNA-directed RNA polymerase subunit A'' [Nanoarchaeota archaeon]|nr:DNA-directed RNA polymerase subunit A'' [Nanoarchaeota archaeon]
MTLPQSVEEQLKEMKEMFKLNKTQMEKLRKIAEKQYEKSLIEPGEAVGVVAAQSIGEPGTQLTLRTKLLAGAMEMTVTQGLPRLIEIFDARREPSTPTMTIFLKPSYATSEKKVEEIAFKILEIKLDDIVKSIDVDLLRMRVEVELDPEMLRKYKLREKDIQRIVSEEFKGYKITTGSYKINIKPKGEDVDIKQVYKLKVKLKALHVGGIKGIKQVLPMKQGDRWVIKTAGTNLRDILQLPEVDIENTVTNDIFEVLSVFGIEAAREMIIEETLNVLRNQGIEVDVRHIMLVADVMTYEGTIKGIGRYGVSGGKASVLARASFEVPLKHLFNAAVSGETDRLTSVVENVMINQPVPIGTGMVNLKVEKKEDKK